MVGWLSQSRNVFYMSFTTHLKQCRYLTLYALATPRAQKIFNKIAKRCAHPFQKLNYENMNLVWSTFYTLAPVQEPSREFSKEIRKLTQCKLCVPYINWKDNSHFWKKCSSSTVNTVFQLWLWSNLCLGNCFSAIVEKERDREHADSCLHCS